MVSQLTPSMPSARLILLTRMLTTDLDERGLGWNASRSPCVAAGSGGRWMRRTAG